jgi:hypothetical protein
MSIPASDIVQVNPGVVGTGGNALNLNGVLLSKSTAIPTSSFLQFGDASTVSAYFGAASIEYSLATIYFNSFDNKTQVPAAYLIAPYVDVNRAAWLRSGSLASMTLAQLQALSGVLTMSINGVSVTSSTINLSAATSFTNAATLIQAGFSVTIPTVAWDAITSKFYFTSSTTGASSTITYATGTLSAGLLLTQATGATLSQGDVADTPATAMDTLAGLTQNWCTFTTTFEPSASDKVNFAVWVNAQGKRYQYVAYDTDAQAIVANSSTCFGAVAKVAAYNGVICISGDVAAATAQNTTLLALVQNTAAFYQGVVASIDYGRRNGRLTPAFKSQSGLGYTVTAKASSDALISNGYNFYGAYATANSSFTWFYNAFVPGQYLNAAPYVNEIFLNSQLQLAAMSILGAANSIAYNQDGYSLIRAALQDPIQQGLNSGIIRRGVTLSNAQKALINAAAGADVSNDLFNQGYYLQILDPGAQVRGQGGSPIINLWYTDGGDIRKITIASIVVL